jgi:hypothetical protein
VDPQTARLLGIIGQLIIGVAMLVLVWLLGARVPATQRSPGLVRAAWFAFAVAAIAVVVLAAVRLATVV